MKWYGAGCSVILLRSRASSPASNCQFIPHPSVFRLLHTLRPRRKGQVASHTPCELVSSIYRISAAATGVAALAALAEKVVGALYAREGNTSRAHFAALAAPLAPERRETHLLSAASAFLEMRA